MDQDYVSTWVFDSSIDQLTDQLTILRNAGFQIIDVTIVTTTPKVLLRGPPKAYREFFALQSNETQDNENKETFWQDIFKISRAVLGERLLGLVSITNISPNKPTDPGQYLLEYPTNNPGKIGIVHPSYSTYSRSDLQSWCQKHNRNLPKIQEIWLTSKLAEVTDFELTAGLECLSDTSNPVEVCLVHVELTQSSLEVGISTCIYHKCSVIIYINTLVYSAKYLNQIQFLLKQNPQCLLVANDQLGFIPEVLSIRKTNNIGLIATDLNWGKPQYQEFDTSPLIKATPDLTVPRLTHDVLINDQCLYLNSKLIELFWAANFLSRVDIQNIHSRLYAQNKWQVEVGLGSLSLNMFSDSTLPLTGVIPVDPERPIPLIPLNNPQAESGTNASPKQTGQTDFVDSTPTPNVPDLTESILALKDPLSETINNSIVDTLNTVLYDMINEALTDHLTNSLLSNLNQVITKTANQELWPKLIEELSQQVKAVRDELVVVISDQIKRSVESNRSEFDRDIKSDRSVEIVNMLSDLSKKLDIERRSRSLSRSPRGRQSPSPNVNANQVVDVPSMKDLFKELDESIEVRYQAQARELQSSFNQIYDSLNQNMTQVLQEVRQLSTVSNVEENDQNASVMSGYIPETDQNASVMGGLNSPKLSGSPTKSRQISLRRTESNSVICYQLSNNLRINETKLLPGSHVFLTKNNRQLHWLADSTIRTTPASGYVFPLGYTSVKVEFVGPSRRNDFTFTVCVR